MLLYRILTKKASCEISGAAETPIKRSDFFLYMFMITLLLFTSLLYNVVLIYCNALADALVCRKAQQVRVQPRAPIIR